MHKFIIWKDSFAEPDEDIKKLDLKMVHLVFLTFYIKILI